MNLYSPPEKSNGEEATSSLKYETHDSKQIPRLAEASAAADSLAQMAHGPWRKNVKKTSRYLPTTTGLSIIVPSADGTLG
eukprot:scaffold32453_cov50-Attheya_sp.AAC.2